MLELTRQEMEKLKTILEWVLIATLVSQEEKAAIETIRNKISNILKSEPRKKRIPLVSSKKNEIN